METYSDLPGLYAVNLCSWRIGTITIPGALLFCLDLVNFYRYFCLGIIPARTGAETLISAGMAVMAGQVCPAGQRGMSWITLDQASV